MKIVIAGGSGFIGSYLIRRFEEEGHSVINISRSPKKVAQANILWDDRTGLEHAINHCDVLINMAGKSVDCRYNDQNKKAILDSRVSTTKLLQEVVETVSHPPEVWFNSSTATIYRHAMDRPMDEESGDIGTGFSVNVATSWEKTFFATTRRETRLIALRTAITLGPNGGAYKHFNGLSKIGFGGKQGSGKQMVSFVHVEDVYQAIDFLINNNFATGVFNVSAPNPITNDTFMHAFRTNNSIKIGIPIKRWMLEIGAFFLRTETELLLKSRWVLPTRLIAMNFQFKYNTIGEAISAIGKSN